MYVYVFHNTDITDSVSFYPVCWVIMIYEILIFIVTNLHVESIVESIVLGNAALVLRNSYHTTYISQLPE